MVRRRRNTGSSRSKKPVSRGRAMKVSSGKTLKERLLTTGIWALSLINIALIFSLISNFFLSPNETAVSAGLPKVTNERVDERITVEVLNACNVQGLANQVSEYLRDQGFDVVNVGNYSGGFNLDHTLIFDRVSLEKRYAKKVAAVLEAPANQVVPELEDSMQLMVTVILGRDYKKLKLFAREK